MKNIVLFLLLAATFSLIGCSDKGKEKYQMTDAQLGLTPQQADGRRIYNAQCLSCHASYTGEGRVSFSVKGLYQKKTMPSGIPVNDDRVSDVIIHGKRMMPGIPMPQSDLQALLAYIKTL